MSQLKMRVLALKDLTLLILKEKLERLMQKNGCLKNQNPLCVLSGR